MEPSRTWTPGRTLAVAALVALVAWALVQRDVLDTESLVALAVLFGSVILHEVSHGAVALRFGDDTAKQAGRLTLNPLRHVDPFGTIVLPVILLLANAPLFGWAKPVPVNPGKMRRPRDHSLVVSLAGPAVNIALALLAALALRAVLPVGSGEELSWLVRVLLIAGVVNVLLATFNLIPLPPLDGSAVLERLMPSSWWPGYLKLRQYSMGILFVLVLMLPNALDRVFDPAVDAWYRLLA